MISATGATGLFLGGTLATVAAFLVIRGSGNSTANRAVHRGGHRNRHLGTQVRHSGGSRKLGPGCHIYAGHECGADGAPVNFQIIPVRGRGSCLYHAVAHGWISQGLSPTWEVGPCGDSDKAGYGDTGLRAAISEYLTALTETQLCTLLRGATQDVLPCTDESTKSPHGVNGPRKLLRRINTHSKWAHYEEVALLAAYLNAIIVVYIATKSKSEPEKTVMVAPDGRSATGKDASVTRARVWLEAHPQRRRPRAVIAIVNIDSRHFDALVPCAAGDPRATQ